MKLASRPFGGKLFKEVLFMAYVISSDCIACGACETRCPFGVSIVENLKQAKAVFGQ